MVKIRIEKAKLILLLLNDYRIERFKYNLKISFSMSLEERMGASTIVMQAGMSARPGFYSGRGAISSDLNDKILEKVHQGILHAHGEQAAAQFVGMVADIPKLSATDFLLTLYRLEGNGWQWDKRLVGGEKGIYPDGVGSAWGTIASILGGMDERDETNYIRGEFLRRHGVKQKTPERDNFNPYL